MAFNMVSAVSPILSPSIKAIAGSAQAEENSSVNFGDLLKAAINKVEGLQIESANLANDFAAGKIDNIQQVTIAGSKAELALQFSVQIRNKVLDAYSEIMRMQI